MTVVGDLNFVERLTLLAFDNCSRAVQWTGHPVSHTGDGHAANREMGCRDTCDCASMRSRVVQPDDVRHGRFLSEVALRHTRPVST